jgi:hypothetical protein
VRWTRLVFILALTACQSGREPASDAYAADIDAICHQEERSGALDKPPDQRDPLTTAYWLERNLKTPAGRKFAASIFQLKPSEKGPRLAAEAKKVGLARCPIADTWK